MGAEPFLVASAVAGVMAQRLVRRICPKCKFGIPFDRNLWDLPGEPWGKEVFEGAGCDNCAKTGFKGRRGIFELMGVSEGLESLIINRRSSSEIKDKARELGMRTLREDGWEKAFNGLTTVGEIIRATEEND
jgi:type II secretory ATPase GspE/PulE/Tfp pilus assembly ATPase PilB-like protein